MLELLLDDSTFEDFVAIEKEAMSILQSSITSNRAVEICSKKYASLSVSVECYVSEFAWIADEARYLKQLVNICKRMEKLSDPFVELKQEQINLFKLWFNTQTSKFSRPEDSTKQDLYIEAEKLLADKCLRLEPDEFAIGRRILKAKNTLDMLSEIEATAVDDSLLNKVLGLRKVKKNR